MVMLAPSFPGMFDYLRLLHRYGDDPEHDKPSYIGFCRSPASGFENLFSVTLLQMMRDYRSMGPYLLRDAYFTVNGLYRPSNTASKITGLPNVWRQERNLRYLNACYVDLDVGREEGTPEQRRSADEIAEILKTMVSEKKLPVPSMSARSGRGLYLFWVLHDGKYSFPFFDLPLGAPPPVRAFKEKIAHYKRVQRAIVQYLSPLCADQGAIDAARILRVPGSIHSGVQRQVIYRIQKIPEFRYMPFFYTLDELGKWFGASSEDIGEGSLSHAPDPPNDVPSGVHHVYGSRATVQRGTAPLRANGPRVRDQRRAQDLLLIEQHKRGWKKGVRLQRLRLYAGFLKGAGCSPAEADRAVQEMAGRCRPPYPSDPNDTPLLKIAPSVYAEAMFIPRTETLCSWLQVTPKLARRLQLQSIVPDEVRQERMPPAGGQREIARQARRKAIQGYIDRHGLASSRTIARALRDQGFKVSDWTVNQDLNALDLR